MSGGLHIRRAESRDVVAAIATLGDAFADDPLMLYLFRENPGGVRAGAMEFFSILLRARIALGAPAYVLEQDGRILGAAMGYDASRPKWPKALSEEMSRFETGVPGLSDRIGAYERLAEIHEPGEDHYYLGVIGVHPSLQGRGSGKALLDAFCEPSRADPNSHGIYLETASASSLQFYYRNGFELTGEGSLDGAPLWCVYKRT